MASSGTTTFDLDVGEVIEEAYERAGMELRTGYHLQTARRSINLMMLEWQNRGINLWTVEEGSQALTAGTAEYSLPAGTIDLIEHVIRTGTGSTQADYNLNRVSVSQYANQTNKNVQGRPLQVLVEKTTSPQVTLWPVPDSSDYTMVFWRLRRVQDTGDNAANTMDMPQRFLPPLVSGLAYHLAMKASSGHPARQEAPLLKSVYDEDWRMAEEEDRERASVFLRPYIVR